MSYNELNRMEQVIIDSNRTAYYQYDGAGQRVRKTIVNTGSGGITEVRKYVGSWEVYEKITGAGKLFRETLHISDDTGRIALVDSPTVDTIGTGEVQLLRYQYSNHLSTATLELDDSGAIISYEEYYPYGSTSFQSGRSLAEVSLKRYRYTGKERDEETGLNYHGARYYAPWLCRWTAVDPLESKYAPQSPYVYCSNKPIMHIDDDGMGDELKTSTVTQKYQIGNTPSDDQVLIPRGYEVATWAKTDEKGNAGMPFVIAIKSPDGTTYKWNEKSSWFTSEKGEDYSNPGLLGLSFDISNWTQKTTKSTIGQVALDVLQDGDPFATIKNSYSNYKEQGGEYGIPGFIGTGLKESAIKTYDDLRAGGYRRNQAIIGIWQFGSQAAKGSMLPTGPTIPRGFNTLARFNQAGKELADALNKSGLKYSEIGVIGSSVTNISSKGGAFRVAAQNGLAASDIDVYIKLSEKSALSSSKNIPGFIHPNKLMKEYPLLASWAEKWTKTLQRKITPGAYQP